jgi:hypothetical protein
MPRWQKQDSWQSSKEDAFSFGTSSSLQVWIEPADGNEVPISATPKSQRYVAREHSLSGTFGNWLGWLNAKLEGVQP